MVAAAFRDTTEMINDRGKTRKAAHKAAAAVERDQRVAAKRQFLSARRRERRRVQWTMAYRKRLARLKGRLRGLVGSSS